MSNEQIMEILNRIIRDVLDDDSINISMATTAAEHADWDSLSHINIIVAMEDQFKIKFNLDEMKQFINVGEVIRIIQTKI